MRHPEPSAIERNFAAEYRSEVSAALNIRRRFALRLQKETDE
jgi:hypothetical protein